MEYLERMTEIDKTFTLEKGENGYVLRASGRDAHGGWGDLIIVCTTEEELFNTMEALWTKS